MSKDKVTDYSVTASSNTDVGGININTNCDFGNVDDALREILSHLAETNAGTYPVADTWTFADPADLTKKFRFDGGSITTGSLRVITVPDRTGTMVFEGGSQTLVSKSFADVSDNTKILAFTLSTIATATTRTVTWPNANGTVMLNETFTGLYPTAVSLEGLSLVAGDILYATASDTLTRLPKGTALQNLRMNSGATAPEWSTPATVQLASAWVNFNGTGVVAIRNSHNVTSITDNGTGDYTVNFTSALPSANYAAFVSLGGNGTTDNLVALINTNAAGTRVAPSTTAFRFATLNVGIGAIDVNDISVVIFAA